MRWRLGDLALAWRARGRGREREGEQVPPHRGAACRVRAKDHSGEWDNDRAVWKECLPHAAATSPPPRDHPHGSRWRVWGKGADHRGSRHARASLVIDSIIGVWARSTCPKLQGLSASSLGNKVRVAGTRVQRQGASSLREEHICCMQRRVNVNNAARISNDYHKNTATNSGTVHQGKKKYDR